MQVFLFWEDERVKGVFSSREAAIAAVDPRSREEVDRMLEEVVIDATPQGEVFGPVYYCLIDMDTGEIQGSVDCCHEFRSVTEEPRGHVCPFPNFARIYAQSLLSQEDAIATAQRIRKEYLVSGKPTRVGDRPS